MAADGKVRGIDIGSARWHDIDTPRVLEHAERDTSWRVLRSLN
jgi:NDP-sugar pyrophosphorylase family protein